MDMQFFPAELKSLPQWCVATLLPTADGKDDKRPYDPKTGHPASVTDARTWGTFEQAMALRDKWRETTAPRAQLGFIFNEGDPYCVIDLDTYKAKDDGVRNLHAEIKRQARTYAELSQSSLGTHIIGKGLVVEGARNEANCIELYSHARFMICTGNVGDGATIEPICPIQELIDYLYPLIKDGGRAGATNWRELGDGEESLLTDLEIVERAMAAENSDKFLALCQGDTSMYAGNHSDADAALIQFFAFYTPDNNQVARLFMRSVLAERDKAQRTDYVPRTIAYVRTKLAKDQPPPLDMTAIAQRAQEVAHNQRTLEQLKGEAPVSPVDVPLPPPVPPRKFDFPPGLVGDIARYALGAAIRPVPEIALSAAIAIVAGIVGRQYNISDTGLNQYILLLAKTGTGKESMQSSVDRLFAEVTKTVPAADTFLGPSRFASGQALNKRFQKQPCFMSILGEFGDTMKRVSSKRANGSDVALLSELKDMYHKSGANQMLRATVHSDKEKDTANVQSPTLTILGETAPEPFFAGIDESLIESGFLSRFLVIEYTGERPARNMRPMTLPPAELVQAVADICAGALTMQQNRTHYTVQMDATATKDLDFFDTWVDGQIRGQGEVVRQLWNRAHIKALRLSALIAVGVNPLSPTVTHENAEWAIDMVKRDVAVMFDRFAIGDVGEGDAKLHVEMVKVIKLYTSKCPKGFERYWPHGAIPYRHMVQAVASRPAFKNHRNGATAALKNVLEAMVRAGELMLLEKKDAHTRFGTSSDVYAVGYDWTS